MDPLTYLQHIFPLLLFAILPYFEIQILCRFSGVVKIFTIEMNLDNAFEDLFMAPEENEEEESKQPQLQPVDLSDSSIEQNLKQAQNEKVENEIKKLESTTKHKFDSRDMTINLLTMLDISRICVQNEKISMDLVQMDFNFEVKADNLEIICSILDRVSTELVQNFAKEIKHWMNLNVPNTSHINKLTPSTQAKITATVHTLAEVLNNYLC